jgi:hypothetical protein
VPFGFVLARVRVCTIFNAGGTFSVAKSSASRLDWSFELELQLIQTQMRRSKYSGQKCAGAYECDAHFLFSSSQPRLKLYLPPCLASCNGLGHRALGRNEQCVNSRARSRRRRWELRDRRRGKHRLSLPHTPPIIFLSQPTQSMSFRKYLP